MIATFILAILNMIIPILMMFTSYRNLVNFYFSSTALSSSLINFLYLFYLIQTIRSKILSEMNCRAIYYLQTSCIVVLAYTVTAMHAHFVLYLFPPPTPPSDQDPPFRRCLQSSSLYFRRFFRRFCLCFVLCVWSLSFTSTIPLLYTIDSNEKSPKPVYCPGTTEISYLEEWFNRNRLTQTVLFYLIPLLINLFLLLIALFKLIYDCLVYLCFRLKMSKCLPMRKKSSPSISISSSSLTIQTYKSWISTTFIRFILVLSCCLLACIYPIVMRFYLIYFSVLVPLIFGIFNYSLGSLTSTEQQTAIENPNRIVTTSPSISPSVRNNSLNMNISTILPTKQRENSFNEQFELRSPFIPNLSNKPDESSITPSSSSTIFSSFHQNHRSTTKSKRNYFSNHLYENTRNMFT